MLIIVKVLRRVQNQILCKVTLNDKAISYARGGQNVKNDSQARPLMI